MSQSEKAQNAEEVLPKGLLRKLQGYCSGIVYIPRRRTQSQWHKDYVRILHSQGLSPAEIAGKTTLSVKHIRRIIKQLSDGVMLKPTGGHKIYKSVPEDIVEMVQRYVEGLVYVPPSTSRVVRRHARVKRLLREGHTTSEVAARTGMSDRRVRQLKVEYAAKIAHPKQTAKRQAASDNPIPDTPNMHTVESRELAETTPRRCRICGTVLEPHEDSCYMCSMQPTKQTGDPDIIIVSRLPFAIIDRNF